MRTCNLNDLYGNKRTHLQRIHSQGCRAPAHQKVRVTQQQSITLQAEPPDILAAVSIEPPSRSSLRLDLSLAHVGGLLSVID
jgi:hypothetical protein